eukprot:4196778-Pleurochrysis_carterae.AAC.2
MRPAGADGGFRVNTGYVPWILASPQLAPPVGCRLSQRSSVRGCVKRAPAQGGRWHIETLYLAFG